MAGKLTRRLTAMLAAALLLLPACGGNSDENDKTKTPDPALTCMSWNGYDDFFELLHETYPEIEIKLNGYSGANRTGYSWAQMRADDIPDIFISSQILDRDLAKERLVDLSDCDFVNNFATSVLDQVAIDAGVYLLPTSNSMFGIFYNQTLMEEHGWKLPENFAELESLCAEIESAGLLPGVIGTQLTGNAFSAVFNLAKTDWLTTPAGVAWEKDFLAGNASAAGMWEGTMEYVRQYIDIGMFNTDPEDRNNAQMILDYLGNRKAVFCTVAMTVNITELPDTGDKLGIMPFISRNGDKNVYMYSPSSYIGISSRLTEPGNEKKLENAIKLLSLLFSDEGQSALITEQMPCVMSALGSTAVPEDSLIYDAQQALRDGRAFPMTYAGWENVLGDMGLAFKEWIRGENGMDAAGCIRRMDELQRGYLDSTELLYFCQSTENFTIEETAALVGKALGSAAGADAAVVPAGGPDYALVQAGAEVSGKLYEGKINTEVANSICPAYDGEYAIMTMTGEELAQTVRQGFAPQSAGSFPYVLVLRGGGEPEPDRDYRVAFPMNAYTEQLGRTYSAQVYEGSLRMFVRAYLEEQKTVSPEGNPWE